MLEFYASDYIEITHQFGVIQATLSKQQLNNVDFTKTIKTLIEETNRIGLLVTRNMLGEFLLEIVKANPGGTSMQGNGGELEFHFHNTGLSNDRTCHHIETIYSALKAELRTTLFRVVPRERAKYNGAEWLRDSKIQSAFPTSFRELGHAGTCYSLGQPTAGVFHSMRALEPGLAALAKPFGLSTEHQNWNTIIEQIEARVRQIGQKQKSEDKIADEKFYGAATSHLYFVKNAWRNHVAHTRDTYSDDEAEKILLRTIEFIDSLCGRFKE